MRIIEGEALLNDASGLVCMRFAVIATLRDSFSPSDAIGDFIWLIIGGASLGCSVTYATSWLKDWVSRRYREGMESQILISLLLPYAAYQLAEAVSSSGVPAAVTAGIAMSHVEQRGAILAPSRVRRSSIWEMINFSISGVIFILLGEQLPQICASAADVVSEADRLNPGWLGVYIVAIGAGMVPAETGQQEAENRARIAASQAALDAIARAQQDLSRGHPDADRYADIAARVMDAYRKRIDAQAQIGPTADEAGRTQAIEHQLRLTGLRGERNDKFRLSRAHKLSDNAARRLVREVDLLDARIV